MEERSAFPSLERTLCVLAGSFIGMNLLAVLLSVGMNALSARGIAISPAFSYLGSGAVELICLGLPAVLWARGRERRAAGAVRRDRLDARHAALIIAAAVLSVPAMNGVASLWCALLDSAGIAYSQGMAAPQTAFDAAALLLTTAVLVPVCEEEFFHGRLFAAFEPYGTRRALIFSTLLFALLHGQLGALPAHLIIGGVLGLMLVRRRSIQAAILFHACYNASTVLLSLCPEAVLMQMAAFTPVLTALWLALVYAALRPDGRTYAMPGGRRMSGMASAMLVTLCAAFASAYLMDMLL